MTKRAKTAVVKIVAFRATTRYTGFDTGKLQEHALDNLTDRDLEQVIAAVGEHESAFNMCDMIRADPAWAV